MKTDSAKKNQQYSSHTSPLAIVGIGCMFPKADNVSEFWSNIKNGVDAITEVPESHWRAEDYFDKDPKTPDHVYAKHGGFLSPIDFNPMEYGILPNALEAVDTSQLLGLIAVGQALKDAGYGPERDYDREKVSVILGVTGTLELVIPLGARLGHPIWRSAMKEAGIDEATVDDAVKRISDSYVPWQENSFPGLLGNVVAGRISKHFNLGGTNCVCDAACGSSLSALNLAALELATGKADMVVTGGIDTFNDVFMYSCFSKTPALSPSGHARPFDADGDGTTLGEGLGILVMKRLADAERDGDKIYAVVKGIGTSSDGRGSAIYEPSAAGQEKAVRRAYQDANVEPQSIGLIEAHGTGTKVGDAVEVKALRSVFGDSESPACALGSVKSQIGHTKASAGAAGLIKAALALHHKVLPPTIKVNKPQESVTSGKTPFYVNSEARPWVANAGNPRRAGVSALGFGGSNFHCVLEEYQHEKQQIDWKDDVQIAAFSATDIAGLETALKQFPTKGKWSALRRAAQQSRSSFKPKAPFRIALVFDKTTADPGEKIKNALTLLQKNQGQASWNTPDGTFFAAGSNPGQLAVLFPGQGAQYPGMLKDLASQFPTFLDNLEQANLAFSASSKERLADFIYPRPVFDEAAKQYNVDRLRATEIAQPALGAVSLGAWSVLNDFGIHASAFAGHSYGELTALCAGGFFDRPSLHELSRLRGELMAAGDGDKGSMLAVSAPLEKVEKLLKEEQLNLLLANKNTPEQGVLSGASEEIRKASQRLGQLGIRCTQLTVSAAFHSELVADASGPFGKRLQKITFSQAKTHVYANSTGKLYPSEANQARQLLASQIARPVEFVNEIETMYAAGIRTFLEVGPGARLTGMVKAILAGKEHQSLAIDSSNGKRSALLDLARALAQLAALGYEFNLERWDDSLDESASSEGKKPGMTVQISGANYFKRPPKRPPVAPKPVQQAVPQAAPMVASAPTVATTNQMPTGSLQNALNLTQQSMLALQGLQEQTARLHQQFLEGQENATRSFMALIEQQRQMLCGTPVTANPVPSAPFAQSQPVPADPVQQPAVATPLVSAQAPAAPATPAVDSSRVATVLLEVIAEKTGYPVDMLELEMSLDADLGIDSIKRVEILSALQEKLPGAPAVRPDDLGALQTLGQIVGHLSAGMASTAPAAAATAVVASSAVDSGKIASVLLEVIAEKTGYPVDMLELEMSLDSDLGIDSIKRVEILSALQERLPEAPAVRPDDLGALQTLGQIVGHLSAGMVSSAPVAASVATAQAALDSNKLASVLLEVIAEKTGYPVDMLELEMSLDSDLGIDSIKRVEILSALQERLPEAPAVRPDDLGSLQTLGQIVGHLSAGMVSGGPAAAASAAIAQAGLDSNKVASILLEVIADKTGYPVDMLELEMSLDSDLGIDSIKRVEILSALQERLPEAPSVRPDDLGALQTLGQIVGHLCAGKPVSAPAQPAVAERMDRNTVSSTLLAVIADKTGYPVEMLELDMALDSDLGIDSIKRVEILSALQEQLPGAPAIKPEHLGTLQTVAQIVDFLASVSGAPAQATTVDTADAETPEDGGIERKLVKVVPLKAKGNRQRLALTEGASIWVSDDGSELGRAVNERLKQLGFQPKLVSLDELDFLPAPSDLGGLILLPPTAPADDLFLKRAFRLVQIAGPGLKTAGEQGKSLLVTVSRLNGSFGLLPGISPVDPVSGGLAGLSKTASHEWPQVSCKAIDLAPELKDATSTATALVEEILTEGPLEVGISSAGLHTLKLTDTPLSDDLRELPVAAGDLVVISGGARGVTAEVAVALAANSKATLLLLGRSPVPEAEPEWMNNLQNEADIKKALLGQAATPLKPKDLEQQYQAILCSREIRSTMQRIVAGGGKAIYRSVDLRDSAAVAQVVAKVRTSNGPVKGLIHGAGVLADRLITDKTIEQFELVYSTKIDGLRALLDAVSEDDLRFMVLFSSSTGRFGRTGQVDYAVANEVLNKTAQQQARLRPKCRVVSLNWGPWDGGMVTPALKNLFAQEGIEVIGLQAGSDYLLSEIATPPGGPVELVILGSHAEAQSDSQSQPPANIYISKAFDIDLSVAQYPFLKSHVMDKKAVLPMAMIIEWMAHGAIHNNPGLRFHGFNDLRILKGVTLAADEICSLQVMTGKTFKSGDFHVVPVELSGHNGNGKMFVHARAKMVLATRLPESKLADEALDLEPYTRPAAEIYQPDRLFHGPDFHGIQQVNGCSDVGVTAQVKPAPLPTQWINHPLRNSWLSDPLALDSSFQMMILWSFERYEAGSLPVFAGRYRQYADRFPANGSEIRIHVTRQNRNKATANIDFVDPTSGQLIARIEDYECIIDVALNKSFQLNKLQGAA